MYFYLVIINVETARITDACISAVRLPAFISQTGHPFGAGGVKRDVV
ncbi:hypothetical protein [Dysgonomonas macrotermitis]|nr:hypothetical protein [Dysgonomonas macrotermitis]